MQVLWPRCQRMMTSRFTLTMFMLIRLQRKLLFIFMQPKIGAKRFIIYGTQIKRLGLSDVDVTSSMKRNRVHILCGQKQNPEVMSISMLRRGKHII